MKKKSMNLYLSINSYRRKKIIQKKLFSIIFNKLLTISILVGENLIILVNCLILPSICIKIVVCKVKENSRKIIKSKILKKTTQNFLLLRKIRQLTQKNAKEVIHAFMKRSLIRLSKSQTWQIKKQQNSSNGNLCYQRKIYFFESNLLVNDYHAIILSA